MYHRGAFVGGAVADVGVDSHVSGAMDCRTVAADAENIEQEIGWEILNKKNNCV